MPYTKSEEKNLISKIYQKCESQLGQEIFALVENNFKQDGYFVEFGATNGIELSNTYLLEKEFGWSGIVAKPGKIWHQELQKKRDCHIDLQCVWDQSGKVLSFHESDMAVLSTLDSYTTMEDANKNNRLAGKNMMLPQFHLKTYSRNIQRLIKLIIYR